MCLIKNSIRYCLRVMMVAVLLSVIVACSTTKRLASGEVLYTGVNDFEIVPTDDEKLQPELNAQLKDAIDVSPNNPMPFLSPYVRTPLPIGLWVYNNMSDSAKGLKGWIYKTFVSQPVLIADVRPDVRVKMLEDILDNNGYFASTATYNIEYDKRNPKKARVNYRVDVCKPYMIDSIIYFNNQEPICCFIDSIARKSNYLKVGEKFSTDSLSAERVRITNRMRNRGYYYFRPEYIEFLADSTISTGNITVKLALASNVPQMAKLQYRTGDITVTVHRRSKINPGEPDTLMTEKGKVIVYRPAKLRENLIPSCISFRKDKYFSVRDMDRTQTRLSRLGIFGKIDMQAYLADTISTNPRLNLNIDCTFDSPMEASIEVNAVSKSNSYLGPGILLSLTNKNIFGGAERLSISLNGAYEWQTGKNKSSLFNSYEFGLNGKLSFPRLLAPDFIPRTQMELNWTNISLGAELLNRPHYFKMAQFNLGIDYEWRATRHSRHVFTPFKLVYTNLISTTETFDSIMNSNPAIALSFRSQFIPELSYSYTLDKFLERDRINGINFTATVKEAGNLFDAIWSLCGVDGEKKLFGTPFSQFVKGEAQLVYSRRLIKNTNHWLVMRAFLGAAHAYGNSSEVPYNDQFYIGGANSIRAYTVRSIGPGCYRTPEEQANGYFDQTGTFKVELNAEYRFPIIGMLHGAVFLDAGNVWLLKEDLQRPGGKLDGRRFLKDLALGTGIGLRFDIGMIVIRGDLGYGLHVPYYNGTHHYFNVPFKNAFAFHLAIGYPF